MKSTATAREATLEPDTEIWTSSGYIEAGLLIGLKHRWLEDDTFQIKYDGRWIEAQSIDFLFTDTD